MPQILRKVLLAISVLAVVLIFFIVTSPAQENATVPEDMEQVPFQEENLNSSEENLEMVVDVKGEVAIPGVYIVKPSYRVHEVIEEAGGFTAAADQSMVNLAQKVQDEMIITIPSIKEENGAVPEAPGKGSVEEGKIRINYATAKEIEELPGIGPAKATAIFEFREENGPFGSVEELQEVSGIGEKTVEQLRDSIIIP